MKTVTIRPLSTGEILDGSFTLYRRHFPVLFITALILVLPAAAIALFDERLARWSHLLFFEILATIAMVWLLSGAVLGRPPRMQDGLAMALKRFLYVFVAQIVMFIILIIGCGFFLVPGILLAIMFFAVVRVIVIEGNLLDSFSRSWELARGSMGKIFVVGLISFIIQLVPTLAIGFTGGIFLLGQEEPLEPSTSEKYYAALEIVVGALLLPFSQGVMVLLYYDRRVRKEGLDLELAASALDDIPAGAPEGVE